jgi:hypothetical protein
LDDCRTASGINRQQRDRTGEACGDQDCAFAWVRESRPSQVKTNDIAEPHDKLLQLVEIKQSEL